MKELVYHQMADVEGRHWWFAGRRAIIDDVLTRLEPTPRGRVLEVGCGCGGNFSMLAKYGELWATDTDDTALGYARRSGLARVDYGRLPDSMPTGLEPFDLIVLLDVLEHVDEDVEALRRLRPLLRPGGRLLATVPAYRFLWSPHDTLHEHKRRYVRQDLRRRVESAGYLVRRLTYFNTLLLPAVLVGRLLQSVFHRAPESDLQVPAAPVNRTLTALFASERRLLRAMDLPAGVSLLLVGEPRG